MRVDQVVAQAKEVAKDDAWMRQSLKILENIHANDSVSNLVKKLFIAQTK